MTSEKKPTRDHLNDLLIEYAPIINLHANKFKPTLPSHIDPDDLYSAGMFGLIKAINDYDPKKGASFKTYASNKIMHNMRNHISSGGPNAVDKYFYEAAKKFASKNKPEQPPVTEIKPHSQPEIDDLPEADISGLSKKP